VGTSLQVLQETAAPAWGSKQALSHRSSAPDATVGEIRSTLCHLTRKYTAGVPGRPSRAIASALGGS
jgi:hypothetical protein